MPFVEYNLKELFKTLDEIEFRDPSKCLRKICTLSTPDLILPPDKLLQFLPNSETLPSWIYRPDSKAILGWHKQPQLPGVIDTHEFFEHLGYELTAIDIFPGRGKEVVHDLSTPVPEELHNQFDLVFDIVSNQVLDIKQCMDNCVNLVRPGGAIIHITPVTMVNQGFYSCSPTLYFDYYSARGFTDIRITHPVGTYSVEKYATLNTLYRVRNIPEDTFNFVVTFKPDQVTEPLNLVQGKFQRSPDCKREGW